MLNNFPQESATLRRKTSTVVSNRMQDSFADEPILILTPQSVDGREIDFLPEGERHFEHEKTWTFAQVSPGDHIVIDGRENKVTTVRKAKNPWGGESWVKLFYRDIVHDVPI